MGSKESLVKLADVADIAMGQSPKGETYNPSGEGTPLLNGPTEFGSSHPTPVLWTTAPTRFCKPGDLLFCVRGSTTGRMNWADREYCIGRGVGAFRAKSGPTDTRFIYYTFVHQLDRLLSHSAGSVFPNLSRRDFEMFDLSWPDVDMRSSIVEILGSLDDKIESNRRMNGALEEIAQALFESWFVDFDPVRAKKEGRQPPDMDEETAALFPDSFEDSLLGEIPKGWKAGTLGDIAENIRRGVAPADIPPSTPYIGLEHIPRKSIALDQWGSAEQVGSNKSAFHEGEILFGKLRPYFHKVGVAVLDGVCSTDILVVTTRQPLWYGMAVCHLSSIGLVNHADASSTGTKMPRTNWKDLARYPIVIPSEDVAEDFTDRVRPMVEKIRNNILESRTLATVRDALLPKLLSGEVRVEEARELVEEGA